LICLLLFMAWVVGPFHLVARPLRSTPSKGFSFDFGRWPYPLHAEVNARLQELSRKFPKLAGTQVIGRTGEGRELMVIEITNKDTGPGESKPGLWLDGNMHIGEETGRLYLAYFIERLLFEYGKNPDATRLVDTHTFYVLPVFDADGGERMLTRHPVWPGYKPEEHAGRDLDGDGYITQMRVKDDSQEGRYRYYLEGPGVERPEAGPLLREKRIRNELTGEREGTDFNRNWSAEWEPQEAGAGPRPFSLPEVRSVADFITSHRNIFFCYNIHSGGGGRSYMVRPPMNHPDDFMPLEDNDFYARIGAVWSALSEGGLMQTNYMSWNFNSRAPVPGEGTWVNGRCRYTGFMIDWCYMHLGIHCLTPEVEGAAPDYNDDGYIRPDEVERWSREEKGGRYFSPWKPYVHPMLGKVEIGGSRGVPPALDATAKMHSEWQYDLLLHIADFSPLLRIKDLTFERLSDGKFRVRAFLENQGFLATYVALNAIRIRRDYPVNAGIQLTGGRLVEGAPVQNAGHLPGKLTVIGRWAEGEDVPTKTLEWTIQATGTESLQVSVEAFAPKAGWDLRTMTIKR
jgi:Zinc carboxypeptidase